MSNKSIIEILKNSKVAHLNGHLLKHAPLPGPKVAKHFKKKSAALDYIGWNLLFWCNERAVSIEEEYLFHPERKWRFDYYIPAYKIAVEFEGGIFENNTGHKTAKHYTKDTDKYNAAQSMGFIVLRFTALNYKSLITELNKTISNGTRF